MNRSRPAGTPASSAFRGGPSDRLPKVAGIISVRICGQPPRNAPIALTAGDWPTDMLDDALSIPPQHRPTGLRSNSLVDLAARITAEHEACGAAMKRGIEHAMTAGALLIESKARISHGQWLPWLRDHCGVSERSARRYIQLAQARPDLEAKTATVADLTLREAIELLAPQEVLQAATAIRAETTEARRSEKIVKLKEISAGNRDLDTKRRYSVILADPPWQREPGTVDPSRRIDTNQYPALNLDIGLFGLRPKDLRERGIDGQCDGGRTDPISPFSSRTKS